MDCLAELIGRAHRGDKNARNQLVTENLGLVHAVVRRFEHRGHEREELFQIGCIGLLKAIDKFDLSLGLAFSTYAVPMIAGEIRRYLRDDGIVKVSRSLKENGYRISKARAALSAALGREPNLSEVAAAAELTVEEVVLAMEANREVESIYQTVYEKDGNELMLIDKIGANSPETPKAVYAAEEPEKEAVLNKMVVEQLLDTLTQEERNLIQLRYFENRTQCEAARQLGINQVQVSRLEKKILMRLRVRMGE
jgi:RNA polymerase sporulation-specific sigma factor